jgi:hypothetical protein
LSSQTEPSSKSTTPAPRSADFDKLEKEPVTKLDETAAALAGQLRALNDSVKEERFLWILAVIIILDVIFFKFLASWPESLIIFALELPLLIVLAKRMGVDPVAIFLERIVQRYFPEKEAAPPKVDAPSANTPPTGG